MKDLLLISTGGIVGIVIAVVVVVIALALVIWYISCYNALKSLVNRTEEAWATIDVQLKKRYDLISNLVATVKGYAKHESETLERVIAARNTAMSAHGGQEKMAAENALSGTLKSLFALTEAYPDLKANANFADLQKQLYLVETELGLARKYYNGVVKELNTKIDLFPSNLVAKRMRLEKQQYFELENAAEREPFKVEF